MLREVERKERIAECARVQLEEVDDMLIIWEETVEELTDEVDRCTPYSVSKPCVWPAGIALWMNSCHVQQS